eukprot:2327595-Rhodomonas_salina.4
MSVSGLRTESTAEKKRWSLVSCWPTLWGCGMMLTCCNVPHPTCRALTRHLPMGMRLPGRGTQPPWEGASNGTACSTLLRQGP